MNGIDWRVLGTTLIPVIVPLIITGLKALIPKIPSAALPIVAPVIGAVYEVGMHFATGSGSPLVGAILGSAGVGIREVVDQLRQVQANGLTPSKPAGPLVPPGA